MSVDAFTVFPPEIEDVEWGTVHVGEAEGRYEDGTNVISQHIVFTAEVAGEVETSNIRVAYIEKGFVPEATPPSENAPGLPPPPGRSVYPALWQKPIPLTVQPVKTLPWISSSLGALCLFAGIAWFIVRRRQSLIAQTGSESSLDMTSVQTMLHGATKNRLDGDFYGFYIIFSCRGR